MVYEIFASIKKAIYYYVRRHNFDLRFVLREGAAKLHYNYQLLRFRGKIFFVSGGLQAPLIYAV